MSRTKQELIAVLGLGALTVLLSTDVWWWALLRGIGLGVLFLGINRLPLSLQYRHLIALVTACALASWPKWWVGALMGVAFSALCLGAGNALARAMRRSP